MALEHRTGGPSRGAGSAWGGQPERGAASAAPKSTEPSVALARVPRELAYVPLVCVQRRRPPSWPETSGPRRSTIRAGRRRWRPGGRRGARSSHGCRRLTTIPSGRSYLGAEAAPENAHRLLERDRSEMAMLNRANARDAIPASSPRTNNQTPTPTKNSDSAIRAYARRRAAPTSAIRPPCCVSTGYLAKCGQVRARRGAGRRGADRGSGGRRRRDRGVPNVSSRWPRPPPSCQIGASFNARLYLFFARHIEVGTGAKQRGTSEGYSNSEVEASSTVRILQPAREPQELGKAYG